MVCEQVPMLGGTAILCSRTGPRRRSSPATGQNRTPGQYTRPSTGENPATRLTSTDTPTPPTDDRTQGDRTGVPDAAAPGGDAPRPLSTDAGMFPAAPPRRVVLAVSERWLTPGEVVFQLQRWRSRLPVEATLICGEGPIDATAVRVWQTHGAWPVEQLAPGELAKAAGDADMLLGFVQDLDPLVMAVYDAAFYGQVPALLEHEGRGYPWPPGSKEREQGAPDPFLRQLRWRNHARPR